ncbi:glycoside hydrolase family 3 N-terminal domain-containing protein [Kibdelosporangium aridum]|uniref:Beta-glucosidase n=1 Tax=Kibdelosporangium aridum TaxID=2030 RepID=A0A1W2G069_KIBAR|nr:glycoside hydrolase family 3 N-terminal domain-containing protein [Kibdelosporangium aridum]SMD27278.1 beta-glucosidase [Kibdelosporangium aridum]
MTSRDIHALVRRLDIDQKIAQLQGLSVYELGFVTQAGSGGGWDFTRLPELRPHGVGHLSMVWLLDADLSVFQRLLGELQEQSREISPFGIGALVHGEGVNGFLHESGTQFPTAWAQAATFAPELTKACAAITSAEMRQANVHLCFSPVLDVARDPRWGRVHETYGEDPELISQMGVAFVQGINGVHGDTGVTAVAKHFTGYGASEGGLNQAAAQLGRRAVRDVYAEPFRRAIAEAGLDSVMNSYNEIDGIPAAADPWLLSDLLRGELGLPGAVVSDYDSISMLLKTYHTATSPAEAAAQALHAGLDVELPNNEIFSSLGEALKEGLIQEADLDRAVTRVLRVKQRLGLIPELAPPTKPAAPSGKEPNQHLGQDVAEQAIVLLQNDGGLPLDVTGRDVVVVGPAADEIRIHFGAYTAVANREVPLGIAEIMSGRVPEQVFTDLFQVRFPGIEPAFEAHARQLYPEARTVLDALRARHPHVRYESLGSLDDSKPVDVDAVRDAVGEADVVIAVVGERTGWVGNNTAGEGQSSAQLRLPGNQDALLAALARTGRAVVTVVVSGRPLLLADAAAVSSAMLLAPLLGQYAGDAIARVLTGKVNPSGKLPSTFPRTTGQLPLYHGHHYGSGYEHPTGMRHGYGDLADNGPLFAFGHGLSYTTFSLELEHVGFDAERTAIQATCTVANTGTRAGATVVQLYGRDEAATVVRPVRQLLAFQRVKLAPGERRGLTFDVPAARLAYTQPDGTRGVEPGEVTVLAAFASDDVRGTGSVLLPAVSA